MYIGNKVNELRKNLRMTLVELSDKSGVQVATLSRIENNKMIGSLESHMAIAKALGVDVTRLYSDIIREESRVDVGKSKDKADIFVHSTRATSEILTTNIMAKKMMPVLLTLEGGGQTGKEQHALNSEKFVYVVEGQVEVKIGEQSYPLSKGQTMYFDGSLQHVFRNPAKSTARVICVTTPVQL